MSKTLFLIIVCWFALISAITAIVTVADKIKAKKGTFRISEKALFVLAILGGGVSEYFTMRLIRHKTLHKKFMIGLPVIIIFQLVLITALFYKLYFT